MIKKIILGLVLVLLTTSVYGLELIEKSSRDVLFSTNKSEFPINVSIIFSHWFEEDFIFEKNINSSNFTIPLYYLYQNFQDSFKLEGVILDSNESFNFSEKFIFEDLDNEYLSPELNFNLVSYDLGIFSASIEYLDAASYEVISVMGEKLNGSFLFEKVIPINPESEINFSVDLENYSGDFLLYIDSEFNLPINDRSNLVHLIEKNNSFRGCSFEKEFNGVFVFDPECGSVCPDVIPKKDIWILLECYEGEKFKISTFETSPEINLNESEGIVHLIYSSSKNRNFTLDTNVPTKISNNKITCMQEKRTENISVVEGEYFKISFQVSDSTFINLSRKK